MAILVSGIVAGLNQPTIAQVTIEIVNDTGRPDTNIFIKVPGELWTGVPADPPPVTPTNLFVNTTNATGNATSLPLSDLATSGTVAPYQIVSSISGNTNTVYTFQVDYLNSGAIFFTFDQPFTFTNGLQPSPPPDSVGNAYRYDYAELSINDQAAANNAVDVTYVDKFGIPIQMEWFSGSNLVSGSYVYASTKSLVEDFSANGFGQAVFALGASNITPGWQYAGPNSYSNFARILAPQKVSGTNTSVAPYPSITNYLNSLVGSSNAFELNGAAPQAGYHYVGYQVSLSTDTNGWLATLAHTTNAPAYNPSIITGTPYTNTITVPINAANASQYLYGSPVGPTLYSVNGVLVTNDTSPTYKVETWMIGDMLSALNFGFWGGRYGTNSANWYSTVQWTSFPFGSARNTDDEYYNPYAALIYNYSDPYSYAFSERITPDVLMSPGNGDRIRITLLPDDRLDSPVVPIPEASAITANSITLNWTPVAGANGYMVNVLRPSGMPPVPLPSSSSSYTLSNLQPGTPYVMSVQATGTANGNPIITPARPVAATTLGDNTTTNGTFTEVQVTFNANDPFYQLESAFINGIQVFATNSWLTTNNTPARWLAWPGANQVVVTVIGSGNEVLFSDWLTFTLSPAFEVTNYFYGSDTVITNTSTEASTNFCCAHATNTVTMNSAISNVFMFGQKLSQPPPGASGFASPQYFYTTYIYGTNVQVIPNVVAVPTNYTANANSFLVSTQNPSVSIGLSYLPAETRKFAPLKTPKPPVSILSYEALPAGGLYFTFDVPNGTPYSVEAGENLTSWQTLTNETGQAGVESYSDSPATASGRRFYRIRY